MREAIEAASWITLVALGTAANSIWPIPVEVCAVFTALVLTVLLFSAWRRFDGGRHPCFLFLAMMVIFQGGRLIGFVLGVTREPMQIEVATAVPLNVSSESARIALFLIVVSALCAYIPCLLSYRPAALRETRWADWLPALYLLIAFTFPFALYKDLMYFLYLRSHGGYLAVYTDNAAVLQSAGPIARSVSIVCAAALLIAYVLERRRRWVAPLLTLYFALSILDLLIGFRGKVFTEFLSIWLLHNLKTGRKFQLVPIVASALLLNGVAVAAAAYREEIGIQMLSPISFLADQGVSMNVTEAAVEYQSRFARHGLNYVIGGFTSGITPSNPTDEGRLWTADLTKYLNPSAAEMGFGTASTFLAELYLLRGIPAVVVGSLCVGYCLAYFHRISSTIPGAMALAFLLPSLIYLPRAELLNPLAVLIKSLAACSIVIVCGACLRFVIQTHAPGSRPLGAGVAPISLQ